MRVNQTVLAKFFDVSTKTIQNWVASGCPYISVGKTKEYETAAVHQWRVDKAIDEASSTVDDDEVKQAVRRQAIAKADSAEADAEMKLIELAKKRGDVVPREKIEALISDLLGEIGQKLDDIHLRYASQMAACSNELEMREVLKRIGFDIRINISKINMHAEEKEEDAEVQEQVQELAE